MNNFYLDNFLDFDVVIESQTEPNDRFEILKEEKNDLHFLRFKTCLQTFGRRNRNQRLWIGRWMKQMINAKENQELLRKGGVPGENGHPVPPTGQVTMERILTIDPNNISHVIKQFDWEGDTRMNGIVETLDDIDGPGSRFMKHILQGLPVSFSTRSVIPQKKNPDGTIDMTGPGRYITSDRVFIPSHEEAYIDESIPVKNICKKDKFETVMESFISYVTEKSDKVNTIVDTLHPAMESATLDKNGILSVKTDIGTALIAPELKYRREMADFMKSL